MPTVPQLIRTQFLSWHEEVSYWKFYVAYLGYTSTVMGFGIIALSRHTLFKVDWMLKLILAIKFMTTVYYNCKQHSSIKEYFAHKIYRFTLVNIGSAQENTMN